MDFMTETRATCSAGDRHGYMSPALAFSRRGDEVFGRIANQFEQTGRRRLAVAQRINPPQFAALKAAMCDYLAACLGYPHAASEEQLLAGLLAQRDTLPNYSPGALLAPKREQTLVFNLLHKRVAEVFAGFDLDGLVDGIDLPINVRVVYGQVGQVNRTDAQPYASTKLHSDVWAGVPADGVVVVMPILGDIEHLTIEMGEMARELELEWMRTLPSYDHGRQVPIAVPYEDVALQHGHVYLADARLLHQTVRRRTEGVRVSIDFRFRMADLEYRAMAPAQEFMGPDSVDVRVPYERWLKVGSDAVLVFDETMDHARVHRKRVQTSVYDHAYRCVDLFEAARNS